MKEFTIQPSDHSDADVSDEENWCTTTDTSIHSDLGSFLEDMALHEGDVTDYDSDDDDDYYDDFDFDETATSEESDYSEDEEEDIDKEKEPTSKTAEVKEQLSKVTIPEVSSDDESDNSSASYSSSYSSASELSDTEMLEPDDLFIEKPALGYQENTCHQDSRPECIEKKMVREL